MEGVLAWEDKKLAGEEGVLTHVASLAGFDYGIALVEGYDVAADVAGGVGGLVHFFLELVDVVGIVLESRADFFLEGVDYGKVWEKGD